MLWPKKALILTHFAPNSTLFGVGGEGSLVLVISLERSQHFWPPLSENHFVYKTRRCFVSCCTMNTLMLELIFWRRYDIFFQTTDSYSFALTVLEIITTLAVTSLIEHFSVICLQSFFFVFVKSNVASVTLWATVPDMPNGRYFIVAWTLMPKKTV